MAGNVRGGKFGSTEYTVQNSAALGHNLGELAHPSVDTAMAGVSSAVVAPRVGRTFLIGNIAGTLLHSATTSSYYGVATELHRDVPT